MVWALPNPVGTGGVLYVWCCGGVGEEWGVDMGIGTGPGIVGWCYIYIYVHCESGFYVDSRFMYLYIVLGNYLRISGAPNVQSCCTLSISSPTVYLGMADIVNPDLFVYSCMSWICLDITRFYEEQHQPSIGSA